MVAAAAAPTALEAAVGAYARGQFEAARAQFEKLSRAGVAAADYNLAVMHLRGEVADPNERANLQEAERLMTRAAERGFVTAQYGLAQLYDGDTLGAPDLARANAWYLRAARSGSVQAQVAIATAYYLGRGTPKDLAQAAHWYWQAARGGDVGAQYLLASMYEAGDGVQRDLQVARFWYDVAARNGDEAAPVKVLELDERLKTPPS